MNDWLKKHFTIGGLVTLATAIATLITLVGALYVFADDMTETQLVVEKNTTVIEANMKHTERTDVHHTNEGLELKFVSKPVFEQFQVQLFKQLDRIEERLEK
jgi:hypothetical protein